MALTNLGLMTMTGRSNGKTGIMNTTVSFLVRSLTGIMIHIRRILAQVIRALVSL